MLYPFSRLCRPARSPASCGPALRRKMGFNLIESAVVLGVVGLVIGGIWVAAAAVSENVKVARTISGILTIAKSTQNVISVQDSDVIGNSVGITPALVGSGAFPKDWVQGASAKHPFGGAVSITNFKNTNRFDMSFYGMPESACIKLVAGMSRAGSSGTGTGTDRYYKGNGLGYIQVIDSATSTLGLATATFPVTPEQASVGCVDGINQVVFTFGYIRIN